MGTDRATYKKIVADDKAVRKARVVRISSRDTLKDKIFGSDSAYNSCGLVST